MSATSQRAARRERQAAAAIGSKRSARCGVAVSDVAPIKLPTGERLIAEVKSRRRLPAIATAALEQAARYARGRGVPVGVVYRTGATDGVAMMWLSDLVRLLGIDAAALPPPTRLRRPSTQLALAGCS